ncbi:S4 domain-containing protein [Porticoccaceae bacterium]|nr:S4 domain-containing protein [Porticoccaceae bacterium]
MSGEQEEKLRIDRWLWAARFFKTRNLAKTAIDSGKVQIDGVKIKPSRQVEIGQQIKLSQGWDEKTVVVAALSAVRRGAPEAALLYSETAQSLAARNAHKEQRRLQPDIAGQGRPNKRQRRQIHRFIHKDQNDQ